MRTALFIAAGAMLLVTSPGAQAPGDRPAGNPRGTRSVAVARNGMIATSQSLASAAGLKVLQDGGNAIDAAITAAGVLAVVEPTMNGIGGDLFAIVYDAKTKRLHALDASGRSAYAATPEEFARRGVQQMPGGGVLTVDCAGRRRGLEPVAAALRHHPAVAGAAAGDPLRARRFSGAGDPRRPMGGFGRQARPGSGRRRDLPARRPGAADGRGVREPAAGADPRARRRRRPRRVLQGPHCPRDRRRHARARRPARRARLHDAHRRLGRHDLDQLPRLRRPRDAAEHAGIRRPRDAEHPRGLRHQGDGPQHGRLPAPR